MSALSLERIREELASYDGAPLRIMEVCGTHTASIVKNGIPSLLSDRIRLISGPGCPVCVTVTAYIDRLTELAMTEGTAVCAFGDLLRVRGSRLSLADAKARGGNVHMVYSPAQMLDLAEADPQRTYVFAAVGFETTIPVYAILLQEAERILPVLRVPYLQAHVFGENRRVDIQVRTETFAGAAGFGQLRAFLRREGDIQHILRNHGRGAYAASVIRDITVRSADRRRVGHMLIIQLAVKMRFLFRHCTIPLPDSSFR